MTIKLKIPKIRFKEFSGEWEEKKLGEVSIFFNSKRIPLTEGTREKGIYPYYGASGIIDYVKDYIFDGEYILLGEDGANIITRSTRLVFLAKGKFWVNNHAHVFQAKGNNYFLCEVLERINYEQYNTGTAQPKLNNEVLKNIKINLPSLPEQQKIASFLSSVDEKIEKIKEKKKNLEEYKKGVMQNIFSQGVRFKDENGEEFGEWKEKKLGEICKINKGTQLNAENLTETGLYPAMNGGINPSGYNFEFNKLENTIIISEGGNSCGYINFIKTKFWCGGHCYALENLKCNNLFLYQILKFSENNIMRLRVGSGLPNIQKKDIENFNIFLPILKEQEKIADFLSGIDEKIEKVSDELRNYEEFKKGLLQGMFV